MEISGINAHILVPSNELVIRYSVYYLDLTLNGEDFFL